MCDNDSLYMARERGKERDKVITNVKEMLLSTVNIVTYDYSEILLLLLNQILLSHT